MYKEFIVKSGNRLLKNGKLTLAAIKYRKEGKSKEWIGKKVGDFCERNGWHSSAVIYYKLKSLKQGKKKFIRHRR